MKLRSKVILAVALFGRTTMTTSAQATDFIYHVRLDAAGVAPAVSQGGSRELAGGLECRDADRPVLKSRWEKLERPLAPKLAGGVR